MKMQEDHLAMDQVLGRQGLVAGWENGRRKLKNIVLGQLQSGGW